MDKMRWIILLAGLGIVLGIYVLSQLQGRRRTPRRRSGLQSLDAGDAAMKDGGLSSAADVDDELQELGGMVADDVIVSRKQTARETDTRAPESAATDRVFALYVRAPAGVPFRGTRLRDALQDAGLEFGDMQIFHFLETRGDREQALFSVANIREPGTFDPAAMDEFTTDGIVLFLQVPGPVDAVRAFDAMVETARGLADSLDATVRDATNSVLTKQTIGHMREEVIACQLQQRVANSAT